MHQRHVQIDPRILVDLDLNMSRELAHAEATQAVKLTAKEQEILKRVASGETDAAIIDQMMISVSSMRTHLDRIRDKTGTAQTCRPDAVRAS